MSMQTNTSLTVRQLNLYVKTLLENDSNICFVSVTGELSNVKLHYASGHWYFTLKDSDAAIHCIMFKANTKRVKFVPSDGMRVVLTGKVTLYEKDGQYQLYVEEMQEYGKGDIELAFQMVKEKLEKEGLFSADSKRTLKKIPKRVAVITSSQGAAVKDITSIALRRFPLCEIILCPVSVQGDTASDEMINALERVYALSDIDAVIIGRGGGSAEDLSAFNDEMLARKIYESPFPVVSAVGHETDFTICDFVSDLRAATPSAAAEIVFPDYSEIYTNVLRTKNRCQKMLLRKYDVCRYRFEAVYNSKAFSVPISLTEKRRLETERICEKMKISLERKYDIYASRLNKALDMLESYSPIKTMQRGFASVCLNGERVRGIKDISVSDKLNIRFADGCADVTVDSILEGNSDGKR